MNPASLPPKIKEWPEFWRWLYEERAGIMEFQGNQTRQLAEQNAERDIRWQYQQSDGQ